MPGSRAMTSTEANHAQIKKELLLYCLLFSPWKSFTTTLLLVMSLFSRQIINHLRSSQDHSGNLRNDFIHWNSVYRSMIVKYHKGKEMHIADALSYAYLPDAVRGKEKDDIYRREPYSAYLHISRPQKIIILLWTIIYKFFVGQLFEDSQSPRRTPLQR